MNEAEAPVGRSGSCHGITRRELHGQGCDAVPTLLRPHQRPASTARRNRNALAAISRHSSNMTVRISIFMFLLGLSLSGCAGDKHIADHVPQFLGGMPDGVPPRRGTPEYDAWMAKRAEEAARPKTK